VRNTSRCAVGNPPNDVKFRGGKLQERRSDGELHSGIDVDRGEECGSGILDPECCVTGTPLILLYIFPFNHHPVPSFSSRLQFFARKLRF